MQAKGTGLTRSRAQELKVSNTSERGAEREERESTPEATLHESPVSVGGVNVLGEQVHRLHLPSAISICSSSVIQSSQSQAMPCL